MVVYLRIIIIIFIGSSFSTISPSSYEQENHLKLPRINWTENSLGRYFKTFSTDLLNRFLIDDLDSSGKRIFRRTNKTISFLLSWETPQNFIFQKTLNASRKDLSDLIIRTLNTHTENIPLFKLNFIKEISSRLEIAITTKDVVAQHCNEIIGLSESLKWNLICRDDKYVNCFSINDNNISSHSLIVACATRDPLRLDQCLQKIRVNDNSLSKNIRRMLHIVVQNNDINSLMLIANTKKMSASEKRVTFNRMAPELVQLALFCASDKVMGFIMPWYKSAKNTYEFYNHKSFREENFLANWFDLPNILDNKNLYAIAAEYHPLLLEKHKNNLSSCYACQAIIFSDKEFWENIAGGNAHSNKKNRIKDCVII